ncbi:hypothetical protein F4781DRAFT_431325 [Annulohypoxylon bovei var. microspora]|nr:hypothetical protein F4781DRAFT_431325 [Annulohypoxylon bovei var. microspora]
MPPKRAAQPQKAVAPAATRKRGRKDAAEAGNTTLDNFVIKKPRISPAGDQVTPAPSENPSGDAGSKKAVPPAPSVESSEEPSEDAPDSVDEPSTGSSRKNQLDRTLPPITDVDAAFWDMASRFSEVLDESTGQFALRIATMCSGTEAPIFALKMLQDFWERMMPGRNLLEFEHLFSAEIVGYKQSYIMRNTEDAILFHDVQDFIDPKEGKAPTAMGSLETIPSDLDILISGCSCVEFSALNTSKKTGYTADHLRAEHGHIVELASKDGYNDGEHGRINAFFNECLKVTHNMGSSGQTFFSMLSYIRDYRPKVVILENVMGAPWAETEKVWFPFFGYSAFHVKLDTKDFYLPQTRNRGYLIALDNSVFADGKTYPKKEEKEEEVLPQTPAEKKAAEAKKEQEELEELLKYDAGKIGHMWLHLLKEVLPRRASGPLDLWLFPAAHPLTERARQDDSEKTLGFGADSEWQRSRIIHIRTRRTEGLGNSRELTQWHILYGHPYDRMDLSIIQYLADRVKDCMDINFLRALLKGYPIDKKFYVYDSRFKNRIYDLSQNIDRGVGGSPFGITGCLTPSGIHYMSDQCRMVSGYETLALQGLPLNRIEFATETQQELIDLAGNAMSTTVIGAVLVAFFKSVCSQPGRLEKYFNRSLSLGKKHEVRLIADSKLKEVPGFSTTEAQPLKMTTIRELLSRSRRYCFCNGSAKYSTDDFVKCIRCLTIRCKWCAGNPEHCFKPTERPADYLLLSEVEQEIMHFFPGTIRGLATANWLSSASTTERTIADIPKAIHKLGDVTFYYESIRVTEVVTICYTGQCGFNVRAKLSEDGITWYLYLDPWSDAGIDLRRELDTLEPKLGMKYILFPQPIAKAKVSESSKSTLPDPDNWQLWRFKTIPMDVSVVRDGDIVRITDVRPHKSSNYQLGFGGVCGSYQHFPTCDGPEHSLHAQIEKKMFLFKDVWRTLTPDVDGYVISQSCRQLENHEYREVLVKFETHVNISKHQTGTVPAHVDGYWVRPQTEGVFHFVGHKHGLLEAVEKLKVPESKHFIINNQEPEQRVLAEAQVVRETECDPYKTVIKYKAQCKAGDGWAIATKGDLHHLQGFLSHLNVKLAGIEDLEISFELTEIEAWLNNFRDWKNGLVMANPRECPYGQLPPIRWIKVGTKYIGHHLTDAMADFEKRCKSRIPIFEPRVKVLPDPDESGKMHAILVQYLIQHKVLGKKAAIYLPHSKDADARITAGVRVERNVVLSENMQVNSNGNGRHKFEPFRNALRSLDGSPPATEPSLDSFKGELSESQLRSLAWMLGRERGDPKFIEQEIEEEIVPELKLRLLGWAKRIVSNHGGVLADDVGYGKTVIMLALMHCQQDFDHEISFTPGKVKEPSCMHLKATLVVVPLHLVDQWAQQALHFLPIDPTNVVTIRGTSDLQDDASWSVLTRLRDAKIIVVSSKLFDDPHYHRRLARLAGSLDPPELSPTKDKDRSSIKDRDLARSRYFGDWYEDAASAARAHVGSLMGDAGPELWSRIDRRVEDLGNEYKVYAEDLSRRMAKGRGVEGESKNDIEINAPVSQRIASYEELEGEMTNARFTHVLDSFIFARVVYDEFSYTNFTAMTFFANTAAHAKWILSATPPTSNLAAVQGIANLINLHIARPIYMRQGMPRITKGPIFRDQTNAEALQNRKLMSDLCIRERHEKGTEFLRTFATSNPLDLVLAGGIIVEEKVVVCELSHYETIQYMDLEHDMRACGLDANRLPVDSRAPLQSLIDANEWTEDGKTVCMKIFLGRSSGGGKDQTDQTDQNQLLEYLRQGRSDQVQRAMIIFKIYVEKAVWLALRVVTNEKEFKLDNAKTSVGDVCMILRDIWCKELEICGGFDTWEKLFEALNIGDYETKFRTLGIKYPDFRTDDREFLRFLNGLRKSSWNDYYNLTVENIEKMTEEEAGELVKDLIQAYGEASVMPNNSVESDRDILLTLLQDDERGLMAFRRTGQRKVPRTAGNQKPLTGRRTKAAYKNLLRSNGAIFNPTETLRELEIRWKAHCDGTLDESEYVGMYDSRAIKHTEFPTFGGTKTIRGGKYTNTRSELSDTSLAIRLALEQLIYALKQQRVVENLMSSEQELRCDNCAQLKPKEDLHLVCDCGHVLCADHLGLRYCGENSSNGARGCESLLEHGTKSLALINKPQRSLGNGSIEQQNSPGSGISSKSQMIANCIKNVPDADQVVLFSQFELQIDELKYALRKNNISYTESPTEETHCKVRILRLNNETSAGTNLQYANHVMFACPLLASLQEQYDESMKQAKGRCIRYGQKKVVHVYHFVTANTIEADILELRRQCHILVRPGKAFGRLHPVPLEQENSTSRNLVAVGAGSHQIVNGGVVTHQASNAAGSGDREERVRSMLTSKEIWKTMNESNWLSSVGIEY